jgi:Peptidase S46
MNRNAILCALLTAAACGPKGSKTTTPIGAGSGSGSDLVGMGSGSAETPPPPPAPDPHLDARKAYSDPGGMWLPRQMTLPQHLQNFKDLGVEVDPKALSNPLDAPLNAIVWLGFCTGSFVSPDGLIVTNHHCAQFALRETASAKHNYVEDGFLAKTMSAELSAGPSQHVMVAQAIRDVTKTMTDGLDKIRDPAKRKKDVEKREKDLIAACEKDHPEVRCQIYSHFRGAEWQLIEYLDLKDIRLVYVPKRTVGDYGGEVDNWHWPRHTGDWSFFRAYVGKDGKPAAYAKDNVPFKPAHWLKVSTEGVKNHDFVMVAGYPGNTSRLDTASEVHFDMDKFYPYLIDYIQARYDLVGKVLETADGETKIKATVAKQFLQNSLANRQGVLAGMKKGNLLAEKDALDAKVKAWAAEKGHEGYKKAIDKLEKLIAEDHKTWRSDFDFGATVGGSSLLREAFADLRMAEERPKKDADRKPGYQQRDMERKLAGEKSFDRSYDRTLDRATFRLLLVRAMALPAKERPWLAAIVGRGKLDEKAIDKALDRLYGGTKLEDEKTRIDLLQKASTKDLRRSKDPFIQIAVKLWPKVKQMEARDDRLAGERILVSPKYAEAMREVLDGNLAPDANSSLRVTYGTVKSLAPDSTAEADLPFTLAHQILEKDTGKDPFNAPPELLAAIKAGHFGPYLRPELGDLPVNFLSDVDITGGNSGSPVLDGKGELVGLAFDGNIEGVASDVVFNGAVSRTIQVDVRYMLWVMDAVDHADNVLEDMGVKPQL